jgi:hypothetical protein
MPFIFDTVLCYCHFLHSIFWSLNHVIIALNVCWLDYQISFIFWHGLCDSKQI